MEVYSYPGHAPGHISLFRPRDKVLIAGDAFVTTCQESAFSVMLQTRKLQGPPKYFTYNWTSAERSVKTLAALEPSIVATGHGKVMSGGRNAAIITSFGREFQSRGRAGNGEDM